LPAGFVVVEEIEREIKQAAGNGFAAPGDMFFGRCRPRTRQISTAGFGLELVNFAGFIGVADGAVHRIAQVNLPINDFSSPAPASLQNLP
jgi:hypothetical protein